MPIDPNIALQVKPFEMPNALAKYAQMQQLQGAQNQNRLSELMYADRQRASADADRQQQRENLLQQATRDALNPETGTLDPVKYRRSLGELGDYSGIQTFDKDEAAKVKAGYESNKAQREAEKEQLLSAKSKLELIGQVAGAAKDDQSYLRGLEALKGAGIDISQIPAQYDPAYVAQAQKQAMTAVQQAEAVWKQKGFDLDVEKFGETKRDNKARLAETIRGHNMADARGKEDNRLKAHEIANGGKAPPGYRWTEGGDLQAITGGPGDKLPESQQKQVVGVNNLNNAIKEYRAELERYGPADSLRPDARATMGTKYNNMMLQAKEAYNLGVLNGPDLDILQSVITDPRSLTGAITSKKALDTQASELARIMQGVAAVSNRARQPKGPSVIVPPAAAEMLKKQPNLRAQFDAKYGEGAAASVLGK